MKRKVTTAIVVMALLMIAGLPARAEASSKDQTQNDLSSLPKIEAYLNSIGIDPGSVVIQQGQFNYAGPNCPGAGWTCTTANKVVQLASATLPAANIVDCSPAVNTTFPALNECVIVQSSVLDPLESASSTNVADCSMDIDATVGEGGKSKSKCTIRQSSKKGNNSAVVRMRTTQRGGSPQFVTQQATIEQMSLEGGSNTAKITQTVIQDLKTKSTSDVTQKQDACQLAVVNQGTNGGNNSSDVQQYQSQDENADSGGAIVQDQNTEVCLFVDFFGGRNATAHVTQDSTTGNITSSLRQRIAQNQDAQNAGNPTASVTQTQSNPAGGLQGMVMQDTDAPGVLRSTAIQDEPQTQQADPVGPTTQLQEGPEFCCAEQNGGTTANENTVTQSNVQNQTPGSGTSFQSTFQNGHCSQTVFGAECTVNQTHIANGDETSQSETGMTVNCSQSGGEGGCSTITPEP